MKNRKILKGVIPVLITPITKEGNIDKPSLEKLTEYLLAKDIGGFWVLGTGAEDMNLTYQERLEVAEIVSNVNDNRVPLILGAGFFALKDSKKFMDDTKHLSVDGYHVMPYHNLLSLKQINWYYKHLADYASKPLWMYTSANWCRFIPPEFIEEIKGYPNIAGIKFSTSNAVHSEKVISLADNEFQVITAVVKQFYANLCLGVMAGTTVEACPYPDLIIDIYKKFDSGDLEGSLSSQRKLNRILEKMPVEPGKDNFLKVAEGKYILSLRGLCKQYMTGYYRELDKKEKLQIRKVLKKYSIL